MMFYTGFARIKQRRYKVSIEELLPVSKFSLQAVALYLTNRYNSGIHLPIKLSASVFVNEIGEEVIK